MAVNFEYKAYDGTGQLVTGTIQAADENEVFARLREQGYFPSSVAEEKVQRSLLQLFQRVQPLDPQDIAVFARQFSIMLETGMPVVNCLDILATQQPSESAREALQDVRRQVSGGQSLAESLAQHRRVFPDMFVNMIGVGETSGNLSEILNRMSDFYERDAKLRGDIKQATTYPKVIISFAFIAIAVVMFVVLPTFADMFDQFGVELPLLTQLVVAFRDFLLDNILWVLLALVAIGWGLRVFFQGARGRFLLDGMLLRIPVVGDLISKIVFTRFARTLGLLFTSGISMVESLEQCEKIVGNVVVEKDIAKARAGVQRGEGITGPLRAEARVFPPMLVEMIAVGEETGGLDQVLTQISDFYDREVEQSVKGLTSIIEPVIMVILGGIIFVIVLSVFMPMFDMVNVIE